MKATRTIVFLVTLAFAFGACSSKTGCPTNGANVGAEKLLSGDGKKQKKMPKYKANKF
jgi:hypothetical protein